MSVATTAAAPDRLQGTVLHDTLQAGEKLVVMDFFCGAGGMSSGAIRVLESIAEEMGVDVRDIAEFVAVNHWDRAIETHQQNHPWVTHLQYDVTELRPTDLYELDEVPLERGDTVHAMIATPDCTHFSSARGGGPKDPDSRATPREILDFVERLDVRNILFENVPDFRDWGPLDEDGRPIPEQKGEYFDTWIKQLTIEGFNVEWRVLNAADYGDATSRKRLFVIGRKDSGVAWPTPTHSECGDASGTEPWRTASDVIDWSDPGESIWVRDLRDGRRSPLANNTMQRIAEGIRRHGHPSLEPFADVLDEIGPEDVPRLRESVVPARYADVAAQSLTEPFLVKYYGTSTTRPVDEPVDTVTSGGQKFALCTPYVLSQHSTGVPRPADGRPTPTIGTTSRGISLCQPETFLLGQHSGSRPRAVREKPLPTVASAGAISTVDPRTFVLPRNGKQRGIHSNPTYDPSDRPLHTIIASDTRQGYTVTPSLIHYSHGGSVRGTDAPVPTIATERGGAFSLADPYLVPFYGERAGQAPRTHDLDAPVPTVTASTINQGLASPFLVEYYGNGHARPVTTPLPTVTTRDRFALVVPELFPLGIDVLFRMLKPSELAAAMGFDPDYEFTGNKTETVKQIGNAVPVNLAESLCDELLLGSSPTIDSYADGVEGGEPADD